MQDRCCKATSISGKLGLRGKAVMEALAEAAAEKTLASPSGLRQVVNNYTGSGCDWAGMGVSTAVISFGHELQLLSVTGPPDRKKRCMQQHAANLAWRW